MTAKGLDSQVRTRGRTPGWLGVTLASCPASPFRTMHRRRQPC